MSCNPRKLTYILTFNPTENAPQPEQVNTLNPSMYKLQLTLSPPINFWKVHHTVTLRSFRQPIRMQYVVNFTSMQYMSTSVDTSAQDTLSTMVACGIKTRCRL